MSKRTCDSCGKKKEVRGGKTCENGHFICSSCKTTGLLGASIKKKCPLCGKNLK